jgi:alpha-1,6-mannosyltransferase
MVTVVANGSVLATGILFKAVLVICWLASLWLVERITRGLTLRERGLAVGAFGWTPASVSQSLAEGHNDIALVVLVLLWLHLMLRAHGSAPIALAASALCKYVSAPLVLVDAIYALRRERATWLQFLARYVAPGLLTLATIAVFYRSMAFFDGLKLVSEWHFLRPSDALMAIEHLTGLPTLALRIAAMLFLVLFAAYWLAVCFWSPTVASLQKTAIAVMTAVLFSGVSHVWPWYVIWLLALSVLVPGWWLSRFVFGLSLLMPFALAAWWIEPVPNHMELAALILYVGAGLWTYATREQQS